MYVCKYVCVCVRVWRFSFLNCHRIHIHKVRAPPVATLLHTYVHTHIFHLISSRYFSGHRLWPLSFLLFGHRQWRPLSFHFISSHHFCGHGQWQPFYTHISFEFIASFLFGHRLWLLSFLFCHIIMYVQIC